MVNTAMDTTVRARLDAVARPGTWPTTMATSRDIDYWRTVNKGAATPSSTRSPTRHPGR
jgi:hypothetical protein